ncbi:MAG: hypothetical protein Q4G43_16285 [Mobilicoccus sp.]|nr:hypothetical protein [Mobilicoccus sp.]
MIVDCGTCPVAGRACADCSVRVLMDVPVRGLALDPLERRAVDIFVGAGLLGVEEASRLTAEVEPWEGVAVAG